MNFERKLQTLFIWIFPGTKSVKNPSANSLNDLVNRREYFIRRNIDQQDVHWCLEDWVLLWCLSPFLWETVPRTRHFQSQSQHWLSHRRLSHKGLCLQWYSWEIKCSAQHIEHSNTVYRYSNIGHPRDCLALTEYIRHKSPREADQWWCWCGGIEGVKC